VRHVQVKSFADVCGAISCLMQTMDDERRSMVVKILVQSNHLREVLSCKALSVVNMCGKITHTATLHVHAPGVQAYIKKERNNFGLTDTVYTRFCNFHTGCHMTSTLFRAGTSSRAISNCISHVFVQDNVQDLLVTNIVYNARLGRPVAANNSGIQRAFQKLAIGTVLLCMPIEECMFVHCLKQRLEDKATLQSIGLEGMQDASVRVNICRTGVVNFFVGLPGGVPLSSNPELRVVSVCETLLQAILSAT
jgi:hypothetical protein